MNIGDRVKLVERFGARFIGTKYQTKPGHTERSGNVVELKDGRARIKWSSVATFVEGVKAYEREDTKRTWIAEHRLTPA